MQQSAVARQGASVAPQAHGALPQGFQRGTSSSGRSAGPPLQQMMAGMPPRELATPAVAGAQLMSRTGQALTMAQQLPGAPQRMSAVAGGGSGGPGSGGQGRQRMGSHLQVAQAGGGVVSGSFSMRV
jgi:hypothetical protein